MNRPHSQLRQHLEEQKFAAYLRRHSVIDQLFILSRNEFGDSAEPAVASAEHSIVVSQNHTETWAIERG